MDSTSKTSPFYSNTATGKIDISNAEWNKVLPKEVYDIAREKGTKRVFCGKYNTTSNRELITVQFAVIRYLTAMANLKAVVAGPVFLNPSIREHHLCA